MHRAIFLLLAASAAGAALDLAAPREPFHAVILSLENDKFFAGSDRHYTQGGRLTYLYDSGPRSRLTTAVRNWLDQLPVDLAAAKLSVAIGQDMFTPEDTSVVALVPEDRPYAAWAYLALGFHAISERDSLHVEFSTGIVGPSARGEEFQNGWHDVMSWFSKHFDDGHVVEHAAGWANQLHDEPGCNLALEWRHRLRPATWFDAVPRTAVMLGNVQTHLSAGGALRFGPQLPDDFGHDLIRAGNGDVARPVPGFRAYFFASADARLVGRNIFLDGNTWRHSHSVRKRPVVADLNLGCTLGWRSWRFVYTQNYRTKEFYGQKKRDVFGSLSIIHLR